MKPRPVKEVTVTFEDGETLTFHTPNGFYRNRRNSMAREQKEENFWIEHEVHWNNRNPH